MEPADGKKTAPDKDQTKKIHNLELELNDLRQGLTVVADYYRDLKAVSRQNEAREAVDARIARPLVDDDAEFEGIWRFHADALVPDPAGHIPGPAMYAAFVRYCARTGRSPVDQDAFEFVFARIENPHPLLRQGEWTGYRLRPDRA